MSEDYNSRKNFVQGHGNFELKLLMSAFFTQNFKKVSKRSDFVPKLWEVAGKRATRNLSHMSEDYKYRKNFA